MAVPDGGLWVGFDKGGASLIKNGQVTSYSDEDGFPVSSVLGFARDRSGTIWAAVVGGFARLEGKRWQRIRDDWNYPSKTARAIMVDRDGTLWVASGNEILFLSNGEKRFQSTGIRAGIVLCFTQAPDGAILFCDDKLKKVRGFRQDGRNKIELLPDINIGASSAVFDRDGALWIGAEGVTRIPFPERVHDPRFRESGETFTETDGLSNASVEAVLEDREGNIWVGTDGGLDRFRHRNVTWFSLRGAAFSLVAGSAGDVWVGSRGDFPVVQVQDRKLAVGGPTDVHVIYRDPDGSRWYSATNSLVHWENGRFIKIPPPSQVLKMSLSATPPDPIIASSITKDHSGNLWVSFGGSGEFRLNNGVWNFVQILPDHPDWSASYAFTDDADRVWLCWGDRIARYDHGNIRIFGAREGLAIGPPDLIAGGDQEIWVGGESGLALFQNESFHTIHNAKIANFTSITGIVVTRNHGIWLSTGSGIVHIPQNEIDNVIQHPEHKVAFELFDLRSDLPEPLQPRPGNYSSGAIQANDGKIWFATRNGAVQVDPMHIYRNPLPPPVSIESVVADDKSYSPFESPALPALTKNLRIEYAALSLSIPERVRFRYKLEGWDNQWHEAGSDRVATFTNLAPRRYSFRVIACNNDGVWNEMGATLNFKVAPSWFQTVWFQAFCVALFLVLLWGLYKLRLLQLHRQFNLGLEARVSERTRIARELHDTLLQSFHGLLLRFETVSYLLPDRPEEAKEKLDTAIEQAAEAITESRDAVQGLRASTQSNDPVLVISTLAQELTTDSINHPSPAYRVAVEGHARNLHPIVRDEICRISSEALRNAFRHAQAQRIEVEIRYDDGQFRLRVRDDGKGIPEAVLSGDGIGGHYGLRGMRERAKLVKGKLTVWSKVGGGTEVELLIPAGRAYAIAPRRSWLQQKLTWNVKI
jgi:signal transduction histidine kinase/ligand-binding sensor domain-containing protein